MRDYYLSGVLKDRKGAKRVVETRQRSRAGDSAAGCSPENRALLVSESGGNEGKDR